MNGVHDMGGLECFGPVRPEPDEMFHEPWEKEVLGLALAMGATGTWNLDQSRFARESLPPEQYLSIGYYRIWLAGLEKLLLEHELVTPQELASAQIQEPPVTLKRVLAANEVTDVLNAGASVERQVPNQPAFSTGELVTVNNIHSSTHTRLPAYIRNHTGVIQRVHGAHVFPDTHAVGEGEQPQWLYNVRFSAAELWGHDRATHGTGEGAVHVDCWESYLSRADITP